MTAQATAPSTQLPPADEDATTTNNNKKETPKTNTNTNTNTTTNTTTNTRLSKTTACLPIVYGSVAIYLGKKADEFQSHEWTLYVRGPNNEDLSAVISKVVFQLHASFAQPIRELSQPPFEVTEKGWGEFEAQIRVIWTDATEKPTVVNHLIKLYPPGAVPNVLPAPDVKHEPVTAEMYDEVVFTDPNELFYRQLTRISVFPQLESSSSPSSSSSTSQQQEAAAAASLKKDKHYDDQEDFVALIGAQKFLQDELNNVKERFQVVSDELELVDQTLVTAQQQQREAYSKRTSRPSSGSSQRKPRPPTQNKKAKT